MEKKNTINFTNVIVVAGKSGHKYAAVCDAFNPDMNNLESLDIDITSYKEDKIKGTHVSATALEAVAITLESYKGDEYAANALKFYLNDKANYYMNLIRGQINAKMDDAEAIAENIAENEYCEYDNGKVFDIAEDVYNAIKKLAEVMLDKDVKCVYRNVPAHTLKYWAAKANTSCQFEDGKKYTLNGSDILDGNKKIGKSTDCGVFQNNKMTISARKNKDGEIIGWGFNRNLTKAIDCTAFEAMEYAQKLAWKECPSKKPEIDMEELKKKFEEKLAESAKA